MQAYHSSGIGPSDPYACPVRACPGHEGPAHEGPEGPAHEGHEGPAHEGPVHEGPVHEAHEGPVHECSYHACLVHVCPVHACSVHVCPARDYGPAPRSRNVLCTCGTFRESPLFHGLGYDLALWRDPSPGLSWGESNILMLSTS